MNCSNKIQIDYASKRNADGRIYYDLYYFKDGKLIKCDGLVAFEKDYSKRELDEKNTN